MKQFYYGFFTYHCGLSMYSDMMGKRLFLKHVDETWMDTSPWLWLAIWCVGSLVFLYNARVKS
jgi:hypothetical protein